MFPSRVNLLAPASNQCIEEGQPSNTRQASIQVGANNIASHLQEHTGRAFENTLGDSSQPVKHITAEAQRLEHLKSMLSNWVDRLPESEKSAGKNMSELLLRKKSNQKSLTLQFYTSEVPDLFEFFTNLENFEIYTESDKLPESIGSAKNLKKLNIRSNNLKTLPEQIGSLVKLHSLTLVQCNHITTLPNTMSQLSKLVTLEITQTNVNNPLPSNINILKNLQNLHLHNCRALGNSIATLQQSSKLKRLVLLRVPIDAQQILEIKTLTTLISLEISLNTTLTEIPDGLLESLLNLTELTLRNNTALRTLPDSIFCLRNLKNIDVQSCDAFEALPERISDFKKLVSLDVTRCRNLRSLPQSIINLPSRCHINLDGTGLSISILENLARQTELIRQQTNGAQGPIVHFSLPPLATGPIGTLEEEIVKWKREAGDTTPLNPAETQHLTQQEEASANAMATLLARFRKTAQYQRSPQGTALRIHAMLSDMLMYPAVLTSFCAMALESNATCDDRTALGLLHIELALLEHKQLQAALAEPLKTQAYKVLLDTAQGVFKQRHLMDIAHEHAKNAKGFVDETEIVLKYITSLGKQLELPAQLDHMLYDRFAWQVKPEHINNAKQKVLNCSNRDKPDFLDFLADWHPWQAAFEHHDPEKSDALQNQLEQIDMNSITNLENLREQYNQACQREDTGELSAKALHLKTQINQAQNQRNTDRRAAWHPTIFEVLTQNKHEKEASTSPPSKRPRLQHFI